MKYYRKDKYVNRSNALQNKGKYYYQNIIKTSQKKKASRTFSTATSPEYNKQKKPLNYVERFLTRVHKEISKNPYKIQKTANAFLVKNSSKQCLIKKPELVPRVELNIEQGGSSNRKHLHLVYNKAGDKLTPRVKVSLQDYRNNSQINKTCYFSIRKTAKCSPSKTTTRNISRSHRKSLELIPYKNKDKEDNYESPRHIEIKVLCGIISKLEAEIKEKDREIEITKSEIEIELKKQEANNNKNMK